MHLSDLIFIDEELEAEIVAEEMKAINNSLFCITMDVLRELGYIAAR